MNHETTPARKNLKLALLAGTCLTTGTTAHAATSFTEVSDFPNTVAAALLVPVPVGTTQVNGSVSSISSDSTDMVAFTSLLAGGSFTMSFSATFTGSWDVLNSSGVHVGSPSAVNGLSAVFTGTVPSDGILVAQVSNNEGTFAYNIDLTATTVPEPSAATLAGLGIAAAALRRTRRTKKA